MSALEELRELDGPWVREIADALIEREDSIPDDEKSPAIEALSLEMAALVRAGKYVGNHYKENPVHREGVEYFVAGYKFAVMLVREALIVKSLNEQLEAAE